MGRPAEVPAAPPGGSKPADEREVVEPAAWCHSRGWIRVMQDAHVEGQARWVLRDRVEGSPRGEVRLPYDAFGRTLLDFQESVTG